MREFCGGKTIIASCKDQQGLRSLRKVKAQASIVLQRFLHRSRKILGEKPGAYSL